MDHEHVGPLEVACSGCFQEAAAKIKKSERNSERWKTVGVIALALVLALVFAGVLSWLFGNHGLHLR